MPLPGFPTSVKGSAVAPTEPLLSFWILFSLSHSPHIRSFSPSSRAQPEPSTSHQSPATALAKPVISHLDKSECHTQWVPGFTLAARAPLNGGHSPITNQIASRPYPKSAEFHITFRTESKVHTRVHKAPSDLGYYHVPKALRSGHTGRLHAPQADRPLHPCSLGRKTPSRIPHFTSTNVEVFPYPLV